MWKTGAEADARKLQFPINIQYLLSRYRFMTHVCATVSMHDPARGGWVGCGVEWISLDQRRQNIKYYKLRSVLLKSHGSKLYSHKKRPWDVMTDTKEQQKYKITAHSHSMQIGPLIISQSVMVLWLLGSLIELTNYSPGYPRMPWPGVCQLWQ